LSDIAGIEDFNGDMDFKIAGSEKGITALQLDLKIPGLTNQIIGDTLNQAKENRLSILSQMAKILLSPRPKISQYAPKVAVLHLDNEKIGGVIGPGGRIIRKIINETGCAIDIEDDGTVNISGTDEQSVSKAIAWIESLTHEVKAGDIFEGTVKRIQPFGAFVEILPEREGLVHISQMASGFVSDPHQVVSLGQKVKVEVVNVDEQGRISLSMLLGRRGAKRGATRGKRRLTSGAGRPGQIKRPLTHFYSSRPRTSLPSWRR